MMYGEKGEKIIFKKNHFERLNAAVPRVNNALRFVLILLKQTTLLFLGLSRSPDN